MPIMLYALFWFIKHNCLFEQLIHNNLRIIIILLCQIYEVMKYLLKIAYIISKRI